MSQLENKWRPLIIGLILVLIVVSLGGAVGTTTPLGQTCVSNVNPCPIFFDQSQNTQTLIGGVVTLSLTFTVAQRELFVIDTIGSTGLTPAVGVSSITDTFLDGFTQQLYQSGAPSSLDIEIWTGFANAAGQDTVTVVWNDSSWEFGLIISTYLNVNSIGAHAGSTGQSVSSGSVIVTTLQSGVWLVGTTTVGTASTITPGSGLVQRNQMPPVFIATTSDAEDTNSSYVNNFPFTYSASWTNGPVNFAMGVIELQPVLANALDLSNECTTTNHVCIKYFTRNSGANSLQNLVNNTAYCAAINTGPVVLSQTQNVQMNGIYSAQARNLTIITTPLFTPENMLVQLEYSNNAPSGFAAGQCATGNVVMATASLLLTTSGTQLTSNNKNEYYVTLTGFASLTVGTYYFWYEITPKTMSVAIENWLQFSSINIEVS